MLQLEQVEKTYRQGARTVEALRGVDLAIDQPGFFALMGPSGSGKTTLLHLAAGLDRADAGRVTIAGEDITNLSERKLTAFRRRTVGIVFQQFNLIATLTARQNVELPGVIDGRPAKWTRDRAAELLEQLGITDRADHRPDALSGGEQQRVAIARALLFQPPILFADEPTGALDTANSDRLWRLLADFAQQQQLMVMMVTHEPAAAVHCSEVFVMVDGRCRGQFDVGGADAGDLAARYQQLGR